MLVEHAVQAPGLVLVPGDAVRDLLGCVAEEVVRLTLHGPDAGVLEEEPIVYFIALARAGWVADFVVDAVVLLNEILQDRAGFEEADHLAIGKGVGEGGDTAVGVDGEEKGLFLSILAQVNLVSCIGEAEKGQGRC